MSAPAPVVELLGDVRELMGAGHAALWEVAPGAPPRLAEFASVDGRAPSLDGRTNGLVTWAAQQSLGEMCTDGDSIRFAATPVTAPTEGTRLVLSIASRHAPIATTRDRLRYWLPRFAARLEVLRSLLGAQAANQRAERSADLLLLLATQLQDHRSLEDLGSALAMSAVHMTGAKRVALVRWHAAEERGEVAFATRGHLVTPEWVVTRDSLTGEACREDRPRLDGSATEPESVVYGADEMPRSVGSLVIVTMRSGDAVIGALVLEGDAPMAISAADAKNLRLLGLLATAALETLWEIEEINRRARTDSLTGLANRQQFEERLTRIVTETNRFGGSCALVLVDIDRFKHVNDTFGHQVGDEVLKQVGAALQGEIRTVDLCARYGGEEMALLLPQTDLAGACQLAERLRRAVVDRPAEVGGRSIPVTISLGVSSYPDGARDRDELFAAADRALYGAKRAGRNKVVADAV